MSLIRHDIPHLSAAGQVLDCAGKHQVLIFVHSRKETAKTAQYLKQTALDNDHLAKFMRDDSASREILQVSAVLDGKARFSPNPDLGCATVPPLRARKDVEQAWHGWYVCCGCR